MEWKRGIQITWLAFSPWHFLMMWPAKLAIHMLPWESNLIHPLTEHKPFKPTATCRLPSSTNYLSTLILRHLYNLVLLLEFKYSHTFQKIHMSLLHLSKNQVDSCQYNTIPHMVILFMLILRHICHSWNWSTCVFSSDILQQLKNIIFAFKINRFRAYVTTKLYTKSFFITLMYITNVTVCVLTFITFLRTVCVSIVTSPLHTCNTLHVFMPH